MDWHRKVNPVTGIVDEATLGALRANAGRHRSRLAQGAAFAAKARQRAGNLTDYTELATGVLCEMTAPEAARLCDTMLENLPASSDPPSYEIWRQRIQKHFQPDLSFTQPTTRNSI